MKSKLREKLFQVYDTKGYDYVVSVADQMLKSNLHKNDEAFRISLHGEIAEVILEIAINRYIAENNLNNWRVSKGLILKDPNNPNEFSTECDLTIFTPQAIVTIECKSYAGKVELKGKGTVYREGKKYRDIWQQNQLHRSVLYSNFELAYQGLPTTQSYPGIKIAFFSLANGSLADHRDEKSKKLMPLLQYFNVSNYLDSIKGLKKVNWNMTKVNRVLDIIERNNSKRLDSHIKYVRKIHQ